MRITLFFKRDTKETIRSPKQPLPQHLDNNRALYDVNDEVRDRATFHLNSLSFSEKPDGVHNITVDLRLLEEKLLEQRSENPLTVIDLAAVEVEIANLPTSLPQPNQSNNSSTSD